jgi:hypothetical protein
MIRTKSKLLLKIAAIAKINEAQPKRTEEESARSLNAVVRRRQMKASKRTSEYMDALPFFFIPNKKN